MLSSRSQIIRRPLVKLCASLKANPKLPYNDFLTNQNQLPRNLCDSKNILM